MKKTSAILFSIILAVIMTVTNMAGTYHSALRVYAAEINEDAQEQDTPDNPLEGTQNPDADVAPPIGAEGEKEKAPEAATDEVETQTAIENTPPGTKTEVPVPQENVTVMFDANGHGTAPVPAEVEKGQAVAKPDDPAADGFTFTGWYTDAYATALWDFNAPVLEAIVLYAGWQENAPHAHTFGEWVTTREATDTETGVNTRACSGCGYEETSVIPVLEAAEKESENELADHNETQEQNGDKSSAEQEETQETEPHMHAFGTEWKYDDTKHWNECTSGDGGKSGEEAHSFGEWTTVKEASDTETGSKERVCSVCGYAEKEEIPVIQNKAPRLRNGDPIPIEAAVETGITLIDDGANAKKVYYDGEPLDLTGLALLVDWNDGTQTTYQVREENVHGFDSSKMGPQTLRITYGISFHVYFDIEVKPLATTPTLTPPTITRQGNTVLISSPSPGTIGYTLDGKDPVYWNKPQNRWNFNGNAAWESYTVPFELGYGTTTVKAAVRAGDGSNASTVTTAVFERSLPRVRVFDQNNGTEYLHNNMTAYNSDNATIRLEGESDTIICYRWFGDPVSYDSASGSYKLADDASLYTGPFKKINSGNSRLAVRQMLPDGSHVSEQTIIFFDSGYESPSGQASVTVTVSPYGTGCEIRADADGVVSQEFAQGVFKVDNGRRVTLTAKPKTGYRFLAWVSNGTVISTNDSMGLFAEGNLSIQAHFTTTNSTGFSVSWNGGSAYSIKGGSSVNYWASGTENVAAGGSFAFSVNPHSGYRKTDSFRVLAGNTPLSLNAQGNYVINPVYQDTIITVEGLEQEPGQTYETKVIAGTGGYACVNGVESVTTPKGTKVTLTAFPDEGYRFLYWTSLPSYVTEAETKTNPLVYTVNQNATVIRPVFGRVEQTYLVSASGDGHGQVTVSPAAGTEGTEVTLRVTPDRGWRVKDWTVVEGGVTVEKLTANTARLTIGSDDISVQANFEPVPGFVYDVAVTATPTGWGTVSASHSSGTTGTEVTLTATPDMLMQFARWEVIKGGVTLSDATAATATFTIGTSDVEIRAVFEDTPITVATSVTVTTDGNGQASANPYGNMKRGTQVTLSATPNTGYKFKEWEITTITGEDASNPVTLSDKTDPNATFYANATRIQIKAHFEWVYTMGDVTVSPSSNVKVIRGYTQDFTATVTGTGAFDDAVTWSVKTSNGNPMATGTGIDANGKLTVDAAENATMLIVTATSNADSSKSGSVNVYLNDGIVTGIKISPTAAAVQEGGILEYTANVEGIGNFYSDVFWVIASPHSQDTKIVPYAPGKARLTVAANESHRTLTIIARAEDGSGISATATVTVVDTLPQYTVSFKAEGGGGTMTDVTVQGNSSYTLPDCAFSAPEGKRFKAWKVNEAEYQPNAEVLIYNDTIVTAVWEDIPVTPVKQFDIKVSATPTNGGTVQGGGTLNENASVTITATPNAGYQFKEWRENGTAVSGAGASYTFTVTKDRTLEAVFEPVPVSITGITISPAGADVIKGSSQRFTASVTGTGAYSSAVTWSINGNQSSGTIISADGLLTVSTDETATTLNVTVTSTEYTSKKASATVTVREKQSNTYTVTFDSNGGSAVASQQVAVNGTATKPADPTRNGYTFDGWYLNGTAYDFTTPVTKDILLTAKWTQLPSTERRVDVRGFSDADIPQSLKNAGYDTTVKIQNALLKAVINKDGSAYGNSYALYEVVLMVSFDGGITWVVATPENFPTGGITVTLPYPTGTGRTTHNFSVAHMFTVAMRGHLPGQTETPPVTKTDNGIRVTLDGLSPVLVSWTEVINSNPSKPSQPTNPEKPTQPQNPGTNSNDGVTNHAETAENTSVVNNDMPTAIQTGVTTTHTTTKQQVQGVRMSQTGDDLYERLGIHTMLFLAALWLVLCMSGRNVRKTEGGGYASDEKNTGCR